jgi:hypothetical protein
MTGRLSVSCPDMSTTDRTDNTPPLGGVSGVRRPVQGKGSSKYTSASGELARGGSALSAGQLPGLETAREDA